MTLTQKQQEAIERIRKVIALATNRGATEGEADNASATVLRLLATHNLTIEDVKAAGDKGSIVTNEETVSEGEDWRAFLAASTARLYFCEYHAEHVMPERTKDGIDVEFILGMMAPKYRHCFHGREHNVVVAVEMFRYFVNTVETLARKAREAQEPRSHALDDIVSQDAERKRLRKFERAFRFGCAKRLALRIDEKWFDMTRSPQTQLLAGNKLPALYMVNDQAVKDYVQEKYGNQLVTKEEARLPSDFAGLFAGFVAGKDVGLDTQVQDDKPKGQLT